MTGAFVAVLLMLYSTGRHCSNRQIWPALGVLCVALLVGVLTSNESFSPDDLLWFFLLFGLPVVAGRALRSRVLLQRELREKAYRIEAERASLARRAIEEERDRIASELQAVVANGVSAMVIQAEAVPRLLEADDTASAELALAAVEETGRDALGEMRRLLGVLRREDEGLALAPQPGLARLEALVERQRERGLEVEMSVEGLEQPLSTGVDLTAYRVLEDALQAAARQRAERATVVLRYGDGELRLEVRDDRSGGASARFPGLRDRVGLYGGHLNVGREDGVGLHAARQPAARGGLAMMRRLSSLNARDWRTIDRVWVALLFVISEISAFASDKVQGPRVLNGLLLGAVSLAFLWRRSYPLVSLCAVLGGLVLSQLVLTPPPDLFVSILMLGAGVVRSRAAPGGAPRAGRPRARGGDRHGRRGDLRPERRLLPGRLLLHRALARGPHAAQPHAACPRAGREGRAGRARQGRGGAARDRSRALAHRARAA